MSTLSDRDAGILELERSWRSQTGPKEQAIRERFGISATRYYRLLGELLANPLAEAHDPILVKRLKRRQADRRRRKVAHLLGAEYEPGRTGR